MHINSLLRLLLSNLRGPLVQYPYLLYKQEFKLKSKRVIIEQGEKEQLNSLQLLYAQLQLDSFEQFDTAEQ